MESPAVAEGEGEDVVIAVVLAAARERHDATLEVGPMRPVGPALLVAQRRVDGVLIDGAVPVRFNAAQSRLVRSGP